MFGVLKTLLFTAALRQSAEGAKRKLRRALIGALAVTLGVLIAGVGLGFLIAFGHAALALATDPQTANLAFGAGFVVIGGIVIAAGTARGQAREEATPPAIVPTAAISGLGRDIEALMSRNAGTLATGAFVAGLLLALRRR